MEDFEIEGKKIVVNKGVENIKNDCFDKLRERKKDMTCIEIPNSVTNVEKDAFSGFDSVTRLVYRGKVEYWDIICRKIGFRKCCLKSAYVVFEINKENLDYSARVMNGGEDTNYGLIPIDDIREIARCLKVDCGNEEKNRKYEAIIKMALVELVESTNLSKHSRNTSLFDLAERINDENEFDLKNGGDEIVEFLATGKKKSGEVNNIGVKKHVLMSFASKYCHDYAVNGDKRFSKFDDIVCHVLPEYLDMAEIKTSEDSSKSVTYDYLYNVLRPRGNYKEFNGYIRSLLIQELNLSDDANLPREKFDNLMWYFNRKFDAEADHKV